MIINIIIVIFVNSFNILIDNIFNNVLIIIIE